MASTCKVSEVTSASVSAICARDQEIAVCEFPVSEYKRANARAKTSV